ncbi:MAG: hypothetical protein AB8I08_17650 [Sandaracinaceae bacterium]
MLAALGLVVGGAYVVAMVWPWSRPCEEQQSAASIAWRAYAETESGPRRAAGLGIAQLAARDVAAALEEADRLGPPSAPNTVHREAMERLALAEAACRP